MTIGVFCEIHGAELKPMIASVSYGFAAFNDLYLEAQRTQFPNSKMTVGGGCCVDSLRFEVKVLACMECRAIEEQWQAKNKTC